MTDSSLYTNASSAQKVLASLQIIANNLANLNTTAFHADFENLVQPKAQDASQQTRVNPFSNGTYSDPTTGPINNTERDLDIALHGPGYIAVQTKSGEKAYTRAGSFDITPDGLLITDKGDLVLGNAGIISIPPKSRVRIDSKGAVSAQVEGLPNTTLEQVATINIVESQPGSMTKGLDGLYYPVGDAQPFPALKTKVIPRSLEGSNVDPIRELIDLVDCSRQFDFQTKQMQTVNDNATKANQLLNIQS